VARADLAALAGTGVQAAAIDTPPLPDAAAFPTVLTRSDDDSVHPAWLIRATPGIGGALGLQLIAGAGLDSLPATRLPDGATPVLLTAATAEQVYGTIGDAVGKPVAGTTFGRGRVAGVVKNIAFRGTWLPTASSFVIVSAEPAVR